MRAICWFGRPETYTRTRTSPQPKMFVGVAIMRGQGIATTSTGSSMSSLDRALIQVSQIWTERFCAPLPHPGLIDSELLREGMVRAAKAPMDPPPPPPPPSPSPSNRKAAGVPAPPNPPQPPTVRGFRAIAGSTLYVPAGKDGEYVARKVSAPDTVYEPGDQQIRVALCYGYPSPHPPPSVIPEATDAAAAAGTAHAVLDAIPKNARDAESFIATAELERAAQLDRVVARKRITHWPMAERPSMCGQYRVKGDPLLDTQIRRAADLSSLDFYLGPGARRTAGPPA